MNIHDNLGDRMKDYEVRNQYFLQRRTPVAIRVDMKSGHSFTKGFQRPFDEIFVKSMQRTAKFMCENIQGAVLSFQQSDEITVILQDYKNLNTDAWFNYRTDKICSISASMATMAFNKAFDKAFDEWGRENLPDWDMGGTNEPIDESIMKLCNIYGKAQEIGAMFDARCFNIPKEEVANLIYWRQLDAIRNSIQMAGQANFSNKELWNKSCDMILEMLLIERNIDWNNFPTHLKRGSCCIKKVLESTIEGENPRSKWFIDENIPIFKGEDREYIEKLIYFSKEE